MLLRIVVLSISVMYAATSPAVPIAANELCNEEQSNCISLSKGEAAENGVLGESDKGKSVAEEDARSVTGWGFVDPHLVALGLTRVLDEKTALMLNTAMYPRGNSDSLIGNYLAARSRSGVSNGTFPERFSMSNDFGNSRWRDWSAPNQKSQPDRYRGTKKQEKIAEQEASWISKTASSIEYALVGILCIILWLWFRQSKAY